MRTILRVIDSISEGTAKVASWACVALIGALVYEVTARYVFTAPTIWAHDISTMLSCTIIVMGWAYVHKRRGHVRVDVFYARLPPRGKVIIDVVLALLFLFPSFIILISTTASHMLFSWSIGEKLTMSYWYPPAGPIRTILLLGFSLFALQAIAQFIRDFYMLIRNRPYD